MFCEAVYVIERLQQTEVLTDDRVIGQYVEELAGEDAYLIDDATKMVRQRSYDGLITVSFVDAYGCLIFEYSYWDGSLPYDGQTAQR